MRGIAGERERASVHKFLLCSHTHRMNTFMQMRMGGSFIVFQPLSTVVTFSAAHCFALRIARTSGRLHLLRMPPFLLSSRSPMAMG